MTVNSAPAGGSPEADPGAATVASPAPPSWLWREAALLLASAAQLVTISALVGADSIAATWPALLLAIAPVPLAAAAAFAPVPADLRAAVAGIAVPVAGIAGQVTPTGLFVLPPQARLAAVPASTPGGRHAGGPGRARAGSRDSRLQHPVGRWAERCLVSAE